jgi:metal-responsive CopG/Arc/MetJ family transcriptional regulator
MRTLIDIPDQQIKDLTAICETEKMSRAEAIRQAIALYLEMKKTEAPDAFGLWKDRQVDGLAYQNQVRSEW